MSGSEIIIDAREVYEALGIVQDLAEHLGPPTADALARLQARMKEYPAEPAGSTYLRTGDLGSSWMAVPVLSGDELGYVESQGVEYADWVQAAESQARMHQGRWPTEEQVKDEEESFVISIYEEYLQGLFR